MATVQQGNGPHGSISLRCSGGLLSRGFAHSGRIGNFRKTASSTRSCQTRLEVRLQAVEAAIGLLETATEAPDGLETIVAAPGPEAPNKGAVCGTPATRFWYRCSARCLEDSTMRKNVSERGANAIEGSWGLEEPRAILAIVQD